jgi:hypothetical protein
LDEALTAAIPHVPVAVAEELRTARDQVEIGRIELPHARSLHEYAAHSDVVAGFAALAHASALVGNACGVDIARLPS